MGTYSYDAWGKPLDENGTPAMGIKEGSIEYKILKMNPFRYRGYRYDHETGFYYLNSRFYDPQIRRMISSDVYDIALTNTSAVTDKNLYAYCDNNPVTREDGDGHFWKELAVGAAIGVGAFILGASAPVVLVCAAGATLGTIGIGAIYGAVTGEGALNGAKNGLNQGLQISAGVLTGFTGAALASGSSVGTQPEPAGKIVENARVARVLVSLL